MGSGTMDLAYPLNEPRIPHTSYWVFVVVWHVFAYQTISQCATPVPALGKRVGPGRFGVPTHPTSAKYTPPVAALGPFEGNPTKIGSFSNAAKFYYTLLWWPTAVSPFFGVFWAFSACSARFGNKNDFLAAQPPQRSFDRPVRWHLGYLRARDAQKATSPLVYVTCGSSNLPVRPKSAPECLLAQRKTGVFFNAKGARLLAVGYIFQT